MYTEYEKDKLLETYKAVSGIINLIENNNKFTMSQKKEILNYFIKRKKYLLNQF